MSHSPSHPWAMQAKAEIRHNRMVRSKDRQRYLDDWQRRIEIAERAGASDHRNAGLMHARIALRGTRFR